MGGTTAFTTRSGYGYTTVKGKLTIGKGSLLVDRIVIR